MHLPIVNAHKSPLILWVVERAWYSSIYRTYFKSFLFASFPSLWLLLFQVWPSPMDRRLSETLSQKTSSSANLVHTPQVF